MAGAGRADRREADGATGKVRRLVLAEEGGVAGDYTAEGDVEGLLLGAEHEMAAMAMQARIMYLFIIS